VSRAVRRSLYGAGARVRWRAGGFEAAWRAPAPREPSRAGVWAGTELKQNESIHVDRCWWIRFIIPRVTCGVMHR
jgi:hypothetical protein